MFIHRQVSWHNILLFVEYRCIIKVFLLKGHMLSTRVCAAVPRTSVNKRNSYQTTTAGRSVLGGCYLFEKKSGCWFCISAEDGERNSSTSLFKKSSHYCRWLRTLHKLRRMWIGFSPQSTYVLSLRLKDVKSIFPHITSTFLSKHTRVFSGTRRLQ